MAIRSVCPLLMVFAVSLMGEDRIREVDFKNFDYPWNPSRVAVPSAWKWLQQKPTSRVRLLGGRHDFSPSERFAGGYLVVRSVTYGDLNGDGQDEAAVDFLCSTGGTANWHYLYVFTLADGSPELLGRLQSGSRAYGGLLNVKIEQNTLILDFADGSKSVGDCCSEGYIRVRYRRQAGRFVEVGTQVSGDVDLRK